MSLGQPLAKNFSENFRRKKIPAISEEKNFLLKKSSANKFSDAPAGAHRQETSPAVIVSADRRNRDKNYRLNFQARVGSKKVYQPPFVFLPIINHAAQKPTECRRHDAAPAVKVVAADAEYKAT